CRQMDGILVHNHLGCFLGKNYKDKAIYLTQLKVPGLPVLRDLVIDPRNDIEHAYQIATEDQARTAYHIAELFLGATDKEASIPAVSARGWSSCVSEIISTPPGKEFHSIVIGLKKEDSPRLLVTSYEPEPNVLVLYPTDELLSCCPLNSFNPEQAI